MSAYLMVEMREVCPTWFHLINQSERFGEGEVREVVAVAQGIHDKRIDSSSFSTSRGSMVLASVM